MYCRSHYTRDTCEAFYAICARLSRSPGLIYRDPAPVSGQLRGGYQRRSGNELRHERAVSPAVVGELNAKRTGVKTINLGASADTPNGRWLMTSASRSRSSSVNTLQATKWPRFRGYSAFRCATASPGSAVCVEIFPLGPGQLRKNFRSFGSRGESA